MSDSKNKRFKNLEEIIKENQRTISFIYSKQRVMENHIKLQTNYINALREELLSIKSKLEEE